MDWPNWVTAFSTTGLLAATGVLAYHTWRLAKATNRYSDATERLEKANAGLLAVEQLTLLRDLLRFHRHSHFRGDDGETTPDQAEHIVLFNGINAADIERKLHNRIQVVRDRVLAGIDLPQGTQDDT